MHELSEPMLEPGHSHRGYTSGDASELALESLGETRILQTEHTALYKFDVCVCVFLLFCMNFAKGGADYNLTASSWKLLKIRLKRI